MNLNIWWCIILCRVPVPGGFPTFKCVNRLKPCPSVVQLRTAECTSFGAPMVEVICVTPHLEDCQELAEAREEARMRAQPKVS